jgi:hypothetical protein
MCVDRRDRTDCRDVMHAAPASTATSSAAAIAASRSRTLERLGITGAMRGTSLVRPAGMRSLWLIGCLSLTTTAHADPTPVHPAVPVRCITPPSSTAPRCPQDDFETRPGYRWQLALLDGLALASVLSGNKLAARAGGVVYLLDGFLMHAAHGRAGTALGSLGLRAGLPIAGALVFSAAFGVNDDIPVSLILGFGIGATIASVIDAAVLAGPYKVRRKAWAPSVSPTPDGVSFGIAGAF